MTETTWLAIFILVISLGVAMGGVWALIRQKVIVNEQGEVTSVEIPFFGKLKTNYPSLVAIFFGIALAAFVWQRVTVEKVTMPLRVKVTVEHDRVDARNDVFLGVIPQQYHIFENGVTANSPKEIELDVEQPGDYQVVVYTITGVGSDGSARRVLEHGRMSVVDEDGSEYGEFEAVLRAR